MTITPRRITVFIMIVIAGIFVGGYHGLFTGQKVFTHDAIMWNGIFQYYIENIADGVFPYWDPYLLAGTYFYPNISLHGLLDPVVLLVAAAAKLFSISPLTAYVYFRLYRFAALLGGVYLLFHHITGCKRSAAMTVGMMLFALTPAYFRSSGMVDILFLTPYTLYFLVRFFEDPRGSRRYLHLSIVFFLAGMSTNVYVPTFYLFNLLAFLAVLPFMKVVNIREAAAALADRKLLLFLATGAVLVALLMAPPLMVALRDAAGEGELFPMVRIAQKNDGNLKRIMASDIGTGSLSSKFTDGRGVFSSYGNMIQTVYPDAFESVPFFADDLMSEVSQYVGIIPFLFAVIGLRYHRSRYRHLALVMLIIITANMFSFEGMSGKPYNIVQKAFNAVFPPLAMAEAREAFGVYFIFYLSMLAALGFSIFFDGERFAALAREQGRKIIMLCAGIIMFKVAVTAYYGGKVVFASAHDAFIMAQVAAFAFLVFLHGRGRLAGRTLSVIIIATIMIDFAVYQRYAEKYIVADSAPHQEMAHAGQVAASQKEFQYLRAPVAAQPGVPFGETILREKGALTYGNNHALFSTKRYYDLLTHVPLQNQLALSGVVFPVVRFYPVAMTLEAPEKQKLLDHLMSADDIGLGQSLFVEAGNHSGRDRGPGVPGEIGSFTQYESVTWYNPYSLSSFLQEYFAARGPFLKHIRENYVNYFLKSDLASLSVEEFSPNEVLIAVNNRTAGYLLYNDGWSKYWQAFDGDRELPVMIANYNSKAVFLEKGEHMVRFVFNPIPYKIGLVAYYIGLVISAFLIALLYLKGRNSHPAGP